MTSEMPLPMPFSVIFSPSQITSDTPATWVTSTMNQKNGPFAQPILRAPDGPSSAIARNTDCTAARLIAPSRVNWVIFLRPSSPSFASFSSGG